MRRVANMSCNFASASRLDFAFNIHLAFSNRATGRVWSVLCKLVEVIAHLSCYSYVLGMTPRETKREKGTQPNKYKKEQSEKKDTKEHGKKPPFGSMMTQRDMFTYNFYVVSVSDGTLLFDFI